MLGHQICCYKVPNLQSSKRETHREVAPGWYNDARQLLFLPRIKSLCSLKKSLRNTSCVELLGLVLRNAPKQTGECLCYLDGSRMRLPSRCSESRDLCKDRRRYMEWWYVEFQVVGYR